MSLTYPNGEIACHHLQHARERSGSKRNTRFGFGSFIASVTELCTYAVWSTDPGPNRKRPSPQPERARQVSPVAYPRMGGERRSLLHIASPGVRLDRLIQRRRDRV